MTKGEKARDAREEKEISQEKLAYVVSVSQGTISKFENNQLDNPSAYMVLKIALVCERDVSDFFDIDKIKMEISERQ